MKHFVIPTLLASILLAGCSNNYVDGSDGMMKTSPSFSEDVSVCYEIFPIAFRDSNDDGIGDINGITQSLDYLQDELQVDCIWITPIHESSSYHKYDVSDYRSIDDDFGTMEDYELLLEETEERGIKVLLDLVVNHTSVDHAWFEGWKNNEEPYNDYYSSLTIEEYKALSNKEGWHKYGDRYYFGSFWSEMPELNYENPAVKQEMFDIAEFWIDKGVDGFRIDAAKHVYDPAEYPEMEDTTAANIAFFKDFNEHIKSIDKNVIILGEVWTQTSVSSKYLEGMDSIFNFDFGEKVLDGINKTSGSILTSKIEDYYEDFYAVREDALVSNFLRNHDQSRTADMVGSREDKIKQAATLLMTHPGIAWIYYGEELGMRGLKPDENIREPFPWTEYGTGTINSEWKEINLNQDTSSVVDQRLDEDSILNHYKDIIALRKENDELLKGDYIPIKTSNRSLYVFKRVYKGDEIIVLANLSPQEVTLDQSIYLVDEVIFQQKALLDDAIILSGNGVLIYRPTNSLSTELN